MISRSEAPVIPANPERGKECALLVTLADRADRAGISHSHPGLTPAPSEVWMHAMTTISVAELRARDICEDQLALFRATFGEEAEVTEANMSRAVDVGLQIEWLDCFLAVPALAAYAAACAPAWESYLAATDQAWAAYEAARDQELAAYDAACDQASAAYDAACDQPWAAYRRALVGPLVRALRAEDGARASLSPSSPNHADMVVSV